MTRYRSRTWLTMRSKACERAGRVPSGSRSTGRGFETGGMRMRGVAIAVE